MIRTTPPRNDLTGLTMTDLMKKRSDVQDALDQAESDWLEANEALETADA